MQRAANDNTDEALVGIDTPAYNAGFLVGANLPLGSGKKFCRRHFRTKREVIDYGAGLEDGAQSSGNFHVFNR